jgi:hypothetical protein
MALDRLEQNHRTELAAHEDYDRWRASARDTKGRVLKGNTKPFTPPELPEGVINLSDPDDRSAGRPRSPSCGRRRGRTPAMATVCTASGERSIACGPSFCNRVQAAKIPTAATIRRHHCDPWCIIVQRAILTLCDCLHDVRFQERRRPQLTCTARQPVALSPRCGRIAGVQM